MEPRRAAVVLVIESHDESREMYELMLTTGGFRCIATGAPDEALSHAASVHFDAVVMDLGLPRLADGLALAGRLSALRDAPPLIAVTRDRLAAAPPVFRTLLMKPVDPDDLLETVRRVIGERGAS